MRILRRALALSVVLPLWIVTILTAGQWCLMPVDAAAHLAVSSAAGMGHAVAPPAHPGGPHAPSHAHTVGAAARDGSADLHSLPAHHGESGRACESQAACSVAIAPAALQLTGEAEPAPWRPAGPPSTRPASLALAPELPPPRA